uniref:Uncharacterized protein n=1 Tax=viral metagenome TaxID=1070528 RepID=A0A6C0AJV5_9ZZZZ
MSTAADYQTDTAQGKPNPSGGCGCTGGRRHRKHRGGVGVVDDALFAVGTSYAAKRFGQKKRLGGRHTRKHRGGAGVVDDALVAGTALGLAHYFTKKGKKGGSRRRSLPVRRTRRSLV